MSPMTRIDKSLWDFVPREIHDETIARESEREHWHEEEVKEDVEVYVNAIGELAGYSGEGRPLHGTTMTMPKTGGTVGRGASIDASDLDCLAVVLVGAPNVHKDIDHGGRQIIMPLDDDDNDNDEQ